MKRRLVIRGARVQNWRPVRGYPEEINEAGLVALMNPWREVKYLATVRRIKKRYNRRKNKVRVVRKKVLNVGGGGY